MAHEGGFFGFRADHVAGVVAERQQRDVVGVAELHEAGGLVGGVAVDGAAEMQGVVGHHADRPAFYADERGDHAVAPAAA